MNKPIDTARGLAAIQLALVIIGADAADNEPVVREAFRHLVLLAQKPEPSTSRIES